MVTKKVVKKPTTKKKVIEISEVKKVQTASPKQKDYSSVFVDSFKLVKNNLVLLLPDILFSLIALIIIAVILKFTGFYNVIVDNFGQSEEILKTAIQSALVNMQINSIVIFTIILAGLLLILLKIFADCTTYGMLASVVKGGKANFVFSLKNSKNFFWRYFWIGVLALIPISILGGITFLLVLKWPIGTLVAVLLLILFIFLILIFTFLLPVLFLDNKGVKETFSRSYSFFMGNKWHVVKALLIMFLFSLLVGVVLDSIGKAVASIAIVIGIYEVIRFLLSLFIEVWLEVFIFKNY